MDEMQIVVIIYGIVILTYALVISYTIVSWRDARDSRQTGSLRFPLGQFVPRAMLIALIWVVLQLVLISFTGALSLDSPGIDPPGQSVYWTVTAIPLSPFWLTILVMYLTPLNSPFVHGDTAPWLLLALGFGFTMLILLLASFVQWQVLQWKGKHLTS